VGVGVEIALVWFAVRYRQQRQRKGRFLHGNMRLEMAWTIIPAIIFAAIALESVKSWNEYRYASLDNSKPVDEILIVAQQFKWNVVYPGPDRKLGDYLVFPRPSDPRFRVDSRGNVLPFEKAVALANEVISENPLGQDRIGPNAAYAADDDYAKSPGRPIVIPAQRQVRFYITSKDVIHDFFLPNFRVKLDAVPGMRGVIDMIAKADSVSFKTLSIDDPAIFDKAIWIAPSCTPRGTCVYDAVDGIYTLVDKDQNVLLNCFDQLPRGTTPQERQSTAARIAQLKAVGVKTLRVAVQPYEVVCEELCGAGHTTMSNTLLVVTAAEYDEFLDKSRPAPAAAAAAPRSGATALASR
jgi:heme/copper-type cytochrome/quinol oxidase subunit 2